MKNTNAGWRSGLLGVFIFSGSLPATRMALVDLSPLFLTAARAVIAALVAVLLLARWNRVRPERQDLSSLMLVAGGVVIGFPLLTALALQSITAARGVVFIALLPLATAGFAVCRGGERPSPLFWVCSLSGAAVVMIYALAADSHAGSAAAGDVLMLAAVIVCGYGYAEGAVLSRRLGGWQVISWALLLSLPVTLPLGLWVMPDSWHGIGRASWMGLAYVSLFSMLLGFVFWYRGLALGGIARVGQLQLLQPFFGLLLAAAVLGETIDQAMIGASVLVAICVVGAKRFA